MYDFSGDMGLESNVSDQQSVQSGIDPSGATSNVVGPADLEYNLKPGIVTNYIKSLLRTNLVRDIQRDKRGQITGITAIDNPFSPQSIYGNITGGNVQTGLMGLVGSVLGPPGMSLAPSIVSAITGQPTTTYTGYNPEDEEETTGESNFSGGGGSKGGDPNDSGLSEADRQGILGTINKRSTSDILREYLQAMDNYYELRPGEFLRRAS